jgi:hypothetical protein
MKQLLLQGMETRAKVDCLLAQTKIKPGPKVDAIYWHLCEGAMQNRACMAFGVKQSKLAEALTTLNEVAEHNERYHELKVHSPDTDEVRDKRVRAVLDQYFVARADCACQKLGCDECLEPAVTAITRLIGE